MFRYLHDWKRMFDRNCENMLPLRDRYHAKSNGNSNQLHHSVAIDSRPDQPGEFLTSPAKKLRDRPPGGAFLRLAPQYTMSGHAASSEEYRSLPGSVRCRSRRGHKASQPQRLIAQRMGQREFQLG